MGNVAVLLWVIFWLSVIGLLSYIAYVIYRKEIASGTCKFVAISNDNSEYVYVESSNDYNQIGYISCGGGGELWVQKTLKIVNNGPGTFYIEYEQDGGEKHELIPNSDLTLIIAKGPSPNVYVKSDSQITTPNFTLKTN